MIQKSFLRKRFPRNVPLPQLQLLTAYVTQDTLSVLCKRVRRNVAKKHRADFFPGKITDE